MSPILSTAKSCVILAIFAGSVFGGWTSAADLAQREVEFRAKILPLLKKTCHDCHSGAEAEDGLALNHFTSAKSLLKERRTWARAVQRVQLGEMPPKDAAPLTKEERNFLTQWLDTTLTEVDCGKTPNPGAVTVRRLNRIEYRNTVRDLLGVDYEPAKDFPGDDVGYGFDNIGDVLTLPPILMEKYIAAAESVTQKAIRAPEPGSSWEIAYRGNQLTPGEGGNHDSSRLLYASNGGTDLVEQVPWTGSFRLELNLAASNAGNEPAKLRVKLDGKDVRVIPVPNGLDQPKVHTIPLTLRAGKRTIRLEFINDYYVEAKEGRPAQDRNLYILDVKLSGFQVKKLSASDAVPDSHKRIMTDVPTKTVTVEQAARKVLQPIVSYAYRRPLRKTELDRLVKIVVQATEEGESYEAAIQFALQAVLISPHFLFKIEEPNPAGRSDAYPRVNDFELATRLSYFLWSSMPDKRLLGLAVKKELSKPEVLAAEVRRMVQDPKSDQFVENFAGQWLNLRKLDHFEANTSLFPKWKDHTKDLLRKETYLYFASVLREDQSILTLLDGNYTFLNSELARYYDVPGVEGDQFQKVSMKGRPRMGLLTQGSILAVTSNPTRTSPVKRGKFILENLLGTPPPPAPAGVPELDKSELRGTLRQRLEQHRENPACASCHQLMDPLGFALENYDAIGQWRTQDPSGKIDASGLLPTGVAVKNAGDLIRVLRTDNADKFARCLTEKILTYATGRGMEYFDKCAVDKICARVQQNDFKFATLMVEVVSSDPFQRKGFREEP
jgi:hypothetical protein